MYKLIVFIPDEAKERVKHALFSVGAGSLGAYSHCSWECLGTGQFLPNSNQTKTGSRRRLSQIMCGDTGLAPGCNVGTHGTFRRPWCG